MLKTYTGPTPTVKTLGRVVASSTYIGPWITTMVSLCNISSYPSLVIKLWATASSFLSEYPSMINLEYCVPSSFHTIVVNSLSPKRDYLYIDDAVNAYYLTMKSLIKGKQNLRIYNVGSKYNMNVFKMINKI